VKTKNCAYGILFLDFFEHCNRRIQLQCLFIMNTYFPEPSSLASMYCFFEPDNNFAITDVYIYIFTDLKMAHLTVALGRIPLDLSNLVVN
jgi:hypothetical protein